MSDRMDDCIRMGKALKSVGFSPDGLECNEDKLKMRGKTREGEITICLLDLFFKLPRDINRDDPKDIIDYIESLQKQVKESALDDLSEYIRKYGYMLPETANDKLHEILDEIG